MADTNSKEHWVYMAKLAEQADRYEEMAEYMSKVAEVANTADATSELSVEERNLLSVAYKNAVGARRASWRVIHSVQQREEQKGNAEHVERASSYRKKVETELDDICQKILALLTALTQNSNTGESKVFYFKMKGDYHRYIAEYKNGDEKDKASEDAKNAYRQAMDIADKDLAVTHPIRLGLALNFSVFHYEVLNNPEEACKMARQAFEDAIAELDNVSEDSYKDSTLIMQLLRDNLQLWTSDEADGA